ncbi:hypothetical protein [Flavobacterium sp. DG2-3]|uniref:Ig-like domain-containing protein n=1 Tax=Flavobacterium sp. DG2-3 TaxID=3068317 RepID=UPI00273D7A59|nr:hypothetical protein [Flavobacterium sp. DG2-3]MDP5202349.1 hypothetical protein [Flavobacterium sp. DG2-3]
METLIKTLKNLRKKAVLVSCLLLFICNSVSAQFTFTNDFKNNTAHDVTIGGVGGVNGTAYLTSGIDDPIGAGWLRLTKSTTQQGGYAYVTKSFPSTLGVLMDFEYKMWRNVNDFFNGADGLGVFLFDAADVEANGFRLGGYGGSLGYAPNADDGTPLGLRGGYVGIGFDALGNFANPNFGPRAGGPGNRPNSVSLRGPTDDSNFNNSNVFLTGVTILNGHQIVDINTNVGSFTENEIDYNTVVATRPEDNVFYRRIQIEMSPTNVNGYYRIIVRWKTDLNSDFVQLIDYTTTDVPPELLSVGFAASTGAGVNFHDVRNLFITTPGNLRISKQADKDFLRAITTGNANEISYYIDVVNDTNADLSNVDFTDKLTDSQENIVPPSTFVITNISHSGFLTGTNLPTSSPINSFTGTVNLAANSTGRIVVTGHLLNDQIPVGNVLTNSSEVSSTTITDEDLGNNKASVTVPVLAEDVDLVLTEQADNLCVEGAHNFKLRVANIGTSPAVYRRIGTTGQRIVVTKVIDAGFTYDDSATPGGFDNGAGNTARWSRFVTPDSPAVGQTTYTYVARYPTDDSDQTLAGFGTEYEIDYPISYSLTPPVGTTSYVNSATVAYTAVCTVDPDNCYTGDNLEILTPTDNTLNNTVSETLHSVPAAPAVSVATVEYCQNATATALTATADPGNTLLWYTTLNGPSSTIAPVPLTNHAGTFTYYVSQANGACESPKTAIQVTILATGSGSISGNQTVCNGILPSGITSLTPGTGTGTITYKWEKSTDGTTWSVISGETGVTYQPPVQSVTTQYRRKTIANSPGGSVCESAPTTAVLITAKYCQVATNPMVRQRVK